MKAFDFDTLIDRRGTGSAKWSRYPDDVLPMWVADMDFAVAEPIIHAIQTRLSHPVLGYGVARDVLRQQIVNDMRSKYDWAIDADHIVFLPGVEPGFNMALKALLNPGDGVLVQTPIYQPILNAPAHWGLARIDAELQAGPDGYYTDTDAFKRGLQDARAFLFCNPHNPTGKVFSRQELSHLAELCMENDTLIIADEIHCDLLFDGRTHTPIAAMSPDIEQRTVTLMAASKTYNIAGLKTAFAIIPNSSLRERFNASRLGMVDSVNILGTEATLAAYTKAVAWKLAMISYLQGNRDYLVDTLRSRLPAIRMIKPEGTFLAWLDCSTLVLPDTAQRYLLEHAKVACSAGNEFGAAYKQFVRLNFGCTRATLEEALVRMERAIPRVQ